MDVHCLIVTTHTHTKCGGEDECSCLDQQHNHQVCGEDECSFLDYQPNHRDSGEDVCTYFGHHHNNHVCVEDACPLNNRPKIYILDIYRRRYISQLFMRQFF